MEKYCVAQAGEIGQIRGEDRATGWSMAGSLSTLMAITTTILYDSGLTNSSSWSMPIEYSEGVILNCFLKQARKYFKSLKPT